MSLGPLPTLNPPRATDLGQLAQTSLMLQAGPLELQQRRQAIQAQQLGIQEQQYQLQQRQAINDAYRQAVQPDANGQPQFDTDKLTKALAASGHGEAIPSIMKGITDYQKSHADLTEAQQKIEVASRDAGGAAGYAIQKANYDPGLADSIIQHQLSTPGLDAQHAQQYQQLRQQIQQNPQSVKQIADQLVAQSPKYTELSSQEATAAARQKTADIAEQRLAWEKQGGLSPDKRELNTWLKDHPGKDEADFMKYKASLAPAATFAINAGAFATPPSPAAAAAPTPEAALAKLDPKMRATVKEVGEYQQKKSEILQRLPGAAKENFNAALDAVYPNYSEANYDTRHKMMLDMTSGASSKQIGAINTAGGHLNELADAADALKNNNVQLINQVANKIGVAIGQNPVTTFNTIVHRVGPELAAAYIQGGGGEGERGTTAADFDPKMGPDQLKSNLAITAKLLGSKISSTENQWKTTMERDDFRDRFLSPEAKAAFQRLSPSTKTTSKQSTGGFNWSIMPEHK
jgi:hypothetical protein